MKASLRASAKNHSQRLLPRLSDCPDTCTSPSRRSGSYELRGEAARGLKRADQWPGMKPIVLAFFSWLLFRVLLFVGCVGVCVENPLSLGLGTRYFVSSSCHEAPGAAASVVPWIDAEESRAA